MQNHLRLLLVGALVLAGCGEKPVLETVSLEASIQEKSWENPYGGGKELRTANYRIFTNASSREITMLLPGFMEASRRNYLRLTNLPDRPTKEPMPIYMLGTREEWAALTRVVVGEQAESYLKIENGGYCYQNVCVFWQMGGLGTFMVAAHEGMHQFLHHRLKDQLPMWLEEGICTVAEGYDIDDTTVTFTPDRNVARFADLQKAFVHGFWIPLDRLLPMDAGDAIGPYAERVTGYYGQLWALTQFIRSDPVYRQGFQRLLAVAEAGRLNDALNLPPHAMQELRLRGKIYNQTISQQVFRSYISNDLSGFEKQYKRFAMKLAQLE